MAHPPWLVCANACQAGATRWQPDAIYEGQAFGVGSAFLLAGTQNYLGTFCVIHDSHSPVFAADVYHHLLQGAHIGVALAAARRKAYQEAERSGLLWASDMHYGNPTFQLPIATVSEAAGLGSWKQAADKPSSALMTSADMGFSMPPREDGDIEAAGQAGGGAEALQESTRGMPRSPEVSTIPHGPQRREHILSSPWKKRSVLSAGVLLALLVMLAASLPNRLWVKVPPDISLLAEAYHVLEQGEWHTAEVSFHRLAEGSETRTKSQAYAGLAAAAFARRDYQQALDFARQAEAVHPEIGYSHVIRGHIFLNQGKVAEATAEYQTATSKPLMVPWQQAVAHNRLGRIHAAQGNVQNAWEHYDMAIGLHQDVAAVYTNKGYLLEQLGRRQEALALYRQAIQINPDDPLTVVLLSEAEQRERLAQDREGQQRIDQLIAELVQAYKEGGRRQRPGDEWTSAPLTLAFLNFRDRGPPFARAGVEEFLVSRMLEALRASGRITVVDRAILDTLLAELKLSTSELVDPQAALRVGRILAARLVATGSFIRLGETGQLTVHMSETETTLTKVSATEVIKTSDALDSIVERLSQALLDRLRPHYPLQGRIAQMTPQGVFLNIGTQQGVTPGVVMEVYSGEELFDPVGLIEVTSVEAQRSRARVVEQTEALQKGWKVREGQKK
jgi:tetratricopeptide (TPR) repeat protein